MFKIIILSIYKLFFYYTVNMSCYKPKLSNVRIV